jgi:hypothetical protein
VKNLLKIKLSVVTLLTLLITSLFLISCSNDNELIVETRIQELKFEKSIDEKLKKAGESKDNSNFAVHTIKINLHNQLIVDEENLNVSEAINKETGVKSFVITEKKKNKIILKSLLLSTNDDEEKGSIKNGYWYNGDDCFIYGTIYTGDDGTQLFVPADVTTQYLMNSCGWSNVA